MASPEDGDLTGGAITTSVETFINGYVFLYRAFVLGISRSTKTTRKAHATF